MGNRGRGILTETDREFLRMNEEERREEFSAPSRSKRRSAIRSRVANAILDTELLDEELEDDLLVDIVDEIGEIEEDTPKDVRVGLVGGLKAQTRLVYRVARAAKLRAKEVIEDAVDQAEEDQLEGVEQQFKDDPQSVSPGDLSDLHQAGVISREEFNDLFRDAVRPPTGAVSQEEFGDLLEQWDEEARAENDNGKE